MTITTDNYELYFYRYAEGELNPQERAEMEAFAAQHPDLAEELALYDPQLKLTAVPTACPDKEALLHRGAAVLPMWRWAAAACVAALLVGGIWLLWPGDEAPQQIAELRLPEKIIEAEESIEPMNPIVPTVSSEPKCPVHKPTQHTPATATQHTSAPTTQVPTTLVTEVPQHTPAPATQNLELCLQEPLEGSLLASVDVAEVVEPQATQERTVIEYTDIVLVNPVFVEEVADSVEATRVSTRIRALRNRVNNTLRDYAYQAYAHTRGELLALADR